MGRAIEHGCASTWLTGTYDLETDTLFWPTGNPCPDFNGDERRGDNLYSDSVLALDPQTGALKWHYQFTPHDLHDWDATETPMLVDAPYGGRERKLLLQGNRNGFFYVLDRTNGQFLGTVAIRARGWHDCPRPSPTPAGARACPSMDGATNWMSTAFDPGKGLFYLMALEKCSIFSKSAAVWKAGESYYGGGARDVPGEQPRQYLRALDLETGKIAWEIPQPGEAESWGGVLATASGLLFYCDDSGAFAAVDAATRRAALAHAAQYGMEGVADDLHGPRRAVCSGGGGRKRGRVRIAGGSINRPAARRDQFQQMLVRIAEIQAAPAARPVHRALDGDAAVFQTPLPVRFRGSGDGKGHVQISAAIVRRNDAAGRGNRIQRGALAETTAGRYGPPRSRRKTARRRSAS